MSKITIRSVEELEQFMEAFGYFQPRLPSRARPDPTAKLESDLRPSLQLRGAKPVNAYNGCMPVFVHVHYDSAGKLCRIPTDGNWTGIKYVTEMMLVRTDNRLHRSFSGDTATPYEVVVSKSPKAQQEPEAVAPDPEPSMFLEETDDEVKPDGSRPWRTAAITE